MASYAGAAPGLGGYGLGSYGCYPTFDYTGWNEFYPSTGYVFGIGSSHQ